MTSPLTAAQRAVLLSGVVSRHLDARAPVPALTAADLRALLIWASHERLGGLLHRAVGVGDLVIDPHMTGSERGELDAGLARMALGAARSSLAAEATGVFAVAALAAAQIDAVVFKGLAAAHTDYGEPAERTFFDADLLVARTDLAAAIDALDAAGCHRAGAPSMSRAWERRFARAVELRHPEGVELDLHASLATGYFGRVLDHDLVRTDTDTIDVGGVRCTVFGATARLLVSAYAVVLSRGPTLRLHGDLVRQLLTTGSDWRRAADMAGPGEVVVAEALRRAGRLLGIDHPAIEWAHDIEPTATARRALEHAAAGEQVGWSADARSTLLALGPADRARYLAGVAGSRVRRLRR